MSLVRNENLFTTIPLELWNLIQENLSLYALITLATTSKDFFQFCTSDQVIGPRFKKAFPEKSKSELSYYQEYIRAIEYEEIGGYLRETKDMMYACKRNNQDAIRTFMRLEGSDEALATVCDKMGFPGTYWLRKRASKAQVFCDEIWKYFEEKHEIRWHTWSPDHEAKKKRAIRLNFAIQLNQPIEIISQFAAKYDIRAFDPTQSEDVKSFMLAITHNHIEMIKVFLTCKFDPYRDIDEKVVLSKFVPFVPAAVSVSGSGSGSGSDSDGSGSGADSDSDSDNAEVDSVDEADETSFKPQMQYPLLAGIYANQLEAVQLMLQHHLDIHHEFGPNKNSALHYAAQWGKKEIVNLLLTLGANLSSSNLGKKSPVYFAAAAGRFSVVRLFFETNAELVLEQCKNSDSKKSPLYAALVNGHGDIAVYLIDNHAPVDAIIANNPGLLIHCIQNNYVECVAVLLKHGAKPVPNPKEVYPKPVLYLAAELGHVAIFNLLVSYGEKIAESNYEESCLHIARKNRHIAMVEELVMKHHVDVNEAFTGLTCLLFLLRDKYEDKYGSTPKAKPEDIAMVLLKAHADPWPLLAEEDNDGGGAIHLACKKGYLQCVTKMLDDHPALIHQENSFGETPIFYAIAKDQGDIVSELLKRGARLDVISRHPERLGFTALHLAAKADSRFIIDLLIAADADPDIEAGDKKPLTLTAMLGAQIKLASYVWKYQENHGTSRHILFAEDKTLALEKAAFVVSKKR